MSSTLVWVILGGIAGTFLSSLLAILTPEAFEELERLKVSIGASSPAEVGRYGLRIRQWAFGEVQSGAEILVRREGETEKVVFPFLTSSKSKSRTQVGSLALPRRLKIALASQGGTGHGNAHGHALHFRRQRGAARALCGGAVSSKRLANPGRSSCIGTGI